MNTKKLTKTLALLATAIAAIILSSCATDQEPKQTLVPYLELERFMGTWYVHGHSPTLIDKQAYAATETYELTEDGKILTEYKFRKGGLDGKEKAYHPVGKVYDTESNAEWRMRFFGILNAPYYILYVDSEYQNTVIGHPGKEMAWIMTRSPRISEEQYEQLKSELTRRDYDLEDFRRIPHP